MNKEHEMILKFPTKQDAIDFQHWLDGSGEQDYWNWQEEQNGDLLNIDYHEYTGELITFSN